MGRIADTGAGMDKAARLIGFVLAVRLLQSLEALRSCWQREGCLQVLIEAVL